MADDCSQNSDPLKLVREGTDQDGRAPAALDPAHAPVNEHGLAHEMVFAQRYAALLKYFDQTDTAVDDWTPFFGGDVSVLLAAVSIEDVDAYKRSAQSWFDYLNNSENQAKEAELKDRLGFLYGSIATLAFRLDMLKQALPADIALKEALRNLIRSQLAPALKRLIAYYKAGVAAPLVNVVAPPVEILRSPAVAFDSVLNPGTSATLSKDWTDDLAWGAYAGAIGDDASVYGPASTVFNQINHCSTHTLFKSVFDQFLKVFAGVVSAANAELGKTLTSRDTHEPHYALFLAFLRLLEYARNSANTLTQRHLDFYYRVILGLEERSAEPGHVHLLAELAKQTPSRNFTPGELFKAGKDDEKRDAFFANERDFVANRATVTSLRTLYRHGGELVASSAIHNGRIFASPVANSDDGLGAPLTSPDGSWHPFFNKVYTEGVLTEIRMPRAQIGFAVASHYLLMAEGERYLSVGITIVGPERSDLFDLTGAFRCFVTTEKGWLEISPLETPGDIVAFPGIHVFQNKLNLHFMISGAEPAIVPYSQKVHGHTFQTALPMLLVTLKQDDSSAYPYEALKDLPIDSVSLYTQAMGMKSVAVSNDFGPIDISKPFQPFGASPVGGSSLVIGSKEIFQKKQQWVKVRWVWRIPPAAYPATKELPSGNLPNVIGGVLSKGVWEDSAVASTIYLDIVPYSFSPADLDRTVRDVPEVTPNDFYSTQSRDGFVRLRLDGSLGQEQFQRDLTAFLKKEANSSFPGTPPVGPTASDMKVDYRTETSVQALKASSPQTARVEFESRSTQFFHLTPFGTAEQHEFLKENGGSISLFPRFEIARGTETLQSEAELYIGIGGLVPPQNLSLLFHVSDGTANPLAPKPRPHVGWSYLKRNEWIELEKNAVQDGTDELLNSGIVSIAVPRDATKDNPLLPGGSYWIRVSVHEQSDAVCRLQLLAAQAMEAVFEDHGNSPSFSATPLPAGTISKLVKPDAAVKSITQPFPSFGGRGAEQSHAFYTRVSERLRHKNRAITLWDYERLVLEAFPQIYLVKCLNHTRYEPSESGPGFYQELAPGHVTIVTLPNLRAQSFRDPLKPYTSLGLLEEIRKLLNERTSCFARLNVRNPQFEEVRVRFSVRLHDGFDETYYSNQLRQAITRFLSPWAFTDGGKPTFGGKVYKSVLIHFVEEQPAVDYVTNFQLFCDINGTPGTADLEAVRGSRAVSILVSAPASKHEITVLKPAQDAPLAESCACEV